MKIKPLTISVNLFLILFAFLNVVGQPGNSAVVVEYKYSDQHFENIETLFSNQQEAVYVRPNINVRNDNKEFKINDDGGYELPIGNIKSSGISYFMNSKNATINEYTVNLDKKRYIVRDTSIVMEWKIDKKSSKKIGDYHCFKATTSFRGRNYVAYYTEDIPLPFGPFKFKGLPGLILELQNLEDDNKHYWVATTIKSSRNVVIPKISELKAPSLNAYEMFLINKKIRADRLNAENARLPKGTSFTKSTSVNLGIEKVFEWETPDNNLKKN